MAIVVHGKEYHKGCVLDDSHVTPEQSYIVVWDSQFNTLRFIAKNIKFDLVEADASNDLRKHMNKVLGKRLWKEYIGQARANWNRIQKNDMVIVTGGRKAEKGTIGRYFWTGEPKRFSRWQKQPTYVSGISLDDKVDENGRYNNVAWVNHRHLALVPNYWKTKAKQYWSLERDSDHFHTLCEHGYKYYIPTSTKRNFGTNRTHRTDGPAIVQSNYDNTNTELSWFISGMCVDFNTWCAYSTATEVDMMTYKLLSQ